MVDIWNPNNWQFWGLIGGLIVLIGGIVWAATTRSVKSVAGGLIVVVVGGLLLFGSIGASFSTQTTTGLPCPGAGCPVNTTGTAIVGFTTTGYPTGEAAALTYVANTHTIDLETLYNDTNSALIVETSQSSTLGKVFYLNFTYSRSDAGNFTAGFTSQIVGIPELTDSSNGLQYAPIGYVAASSTSGGVWQILYDATYGGAFSGTYPSVNAPSATSTQADLTGVTSFGTAKLSMKFTMAGNTGSGSTSGLFGTLATEFTDYSFQVSFAGGAGTTPSSYTINFEFAGSG